MITAFASYTHIHIAFDSVNIDDFLDANVVFTQILASWWIQKKIDLFYFIQFYRKFSFQVFYVIVSPCQGYKQNAIFPGNYFETLVLNIWDAFRSQEQIFWRVLFL